ncbi:MAG: peptidoglycan bridge formation glycyltransferase FemA/FemB family protein [Chlorobi bacterium]|nr:peptidoglycan bridge formation glycyltransferase FemA/FemB family protein [Chlorobiota bacterium]
MVELQPLDLRTATEQWNTLAFKVSSSVTIAFHPELFHFYTTHLSLSPYYFILYSNDKPAGLFPVVKTGNSFISMPHFSGGGILWLNEVGLEEQEIIVHTIEGIIKENMDSGFYRVNLSAEEMATKKLTSVEIRNFNPLFGEHETNKAICLINLKKKEKEQFKQFNPNLRRKINKALRNGIEIRKGKEDLLDDFSHVYNRNMHRLGSPTLGKEFFKALLSSVNETMIFMAYQKNKPIGGSFVMWYDGYTENTWFSTVEKYNKFYTSYLLHWETIRWAVQNGAHCYSMGRSTIGSGTHNYKLQWPVEVKPLYFNRNFKSKLSLKDQKWAIKIWKVLPPFLVDSLGPVIAKRIY